MTQPSQTLSIRLGHGIFFYLDGVQIPDPIDLAQFDELEGGNPLDFYRAIATWADDRGVTHIIDENLAEMEILTQNEVEEGLPISQYTILANSIGYEACN